MKPTQNNSAGTEQKTERQFQDGNIVTVKKKNSHGFKVGEKIRIIKLDNVSPLNNVPSYVPIYYAESTTDPRNQWWIAETEIKESKPTTPPPAGTEKENQSTIAGQELKLVKWVHEGFPPIDLNEQATHVKALVKSYDQLKADNESLRENNERLLAALIKLEEFASSVEACLDDNREVPDYERRELRAAWVDADALIHEIQKVKQ